MANDLAGKRVTVVGLGTLGGGVGVARYAVARGARVTVTDMADAQTLARSVAALEGLPIVWRLGGHEIGDFVDTDMIVRNPGVPRRSPFLLAARAAGIPIEMEMSLFFRACPAPIIGVTGTKGKTTVSTLLGDMLTAWRLESVMAGNMGISALEALDRIAADTPVVIELSSWQLEALDEHRLGPAVAVLTNIHEDHLNHYDGYEDYARTKRSIARHLGPDDVVVYNDAQSDARRITEVTRARLLPFGPNPSGDDGAWDGGDALCVRWQGRVSRFDRPEHVALSGETGTANALAAIAAATARGVPTDAIEAALAAFAGVPNRLETIGGTYDGITFVNDTSATAPIAAAATIGLLATRYPALTVIVGGADKASDFGPMADALATHGVGSVLLQGTGTDRLSAAMRERGLTPDEPWGSLAEAFQAALEATPKGGCIALSPGCASFGMFRNEFERGERFRALVAERCGEESG